MMYWATSIFSSLRIKFNRFARWVFLKTLGWYELADLDTFVYNLLEDLVKRFRKEFPDYYFYAKDEYPGNIRGKNLFYEDIDEETLKKDTEWMYEELMWTFEYGKYTNLAETPAQAWKDHDRYLNGMKLFAEVVRRMWD